MWMRVLAGIGTMAKRERPPLGVWRRVKYDEERCSVVKDCIVGRKVGLDDDNATISLSATIRTACRLPEYLN
jgi:hypothetical protein